MEYAVGIFYTDGSFVAYHASLIYTDKAAVDSAYRTRRDPFGLFCMARRRLIGRGSVYAFGFCAAFQRCVL